jgi:hypothetical protein
LKASGRGLGLARLVCRNSDASVVSADVVGQADAVGFSKGTPADVDGGDARWQGKLQNGSSL